MQSGCRSNLANEEEQVAEEVVLKQLCKAGFTAAETTLRLLKPDLLLEVDEQPIYHLTLLEAAE